MLLKYIFIIKHVSSKTSSIIHCYMGECECGINRIRKCDEYQPRIINDRRVKRKGKGVYIFWFIYRLFSFHLHFNFFLTHKSLLIYSSFYHNL